MIIVMIVAKMRRVKVIVKKTK